MYWVIMYQGSADISVIPAEAGITIVQLFSASLGYYVPRHETQPYEEAH